MPNSTNSYDVAEIIRHRNEITQVLLDPRPIECDGGSGWSDVFVYDEPEGER